MFEINESLSIPENEVELVASRASGPGGQNVNKVSSRITLRFSIGASSLPDDVKEKIRRRLSTRITGDDVLQLSSQEHRGQRQNRDEAIARFISLIQSALVEKKKRRPTRASKGQKEQRLKEKKVRASLKTKRGRVDGSE